MKCLVMYFSCTGHTQSVAQKISTILNADIEEIIPEQLYTQADLDWQNPYSRSSIEMKDTTSRPKIKQIKHCIEDYDVIFVGFPIWWYVAPTIINTFLESYNWQGKVIVPFATSGGSLAGNTDHYLLQSLPKDVTLIPTTVLTRSSNIKNWLTKINIK